MAYDPEDFIISAKKESGVNIPDIVLVGHNKSTMSITDVWLNYSKTDLKGVTKYKKTEITRDISPGERREILRSSFYQDRISVTSIIIYTEDGQKFHKDVPDLKRLHSACFIASAAYRDPDHPRVQDLRWFRDHWLCRSAPGRSFIRAYEQSSPVLARCVDRYPVLAVPVRAVLTPLALMLAGWRQSACGPSDPSF